MVIQLRKSLASRLLAGVAMLTMSLNAVPAIARILSPQPAEREQAPLKANKRARDAADAAAREADAAESQAVDPETAASDDQAARDPDCPPVDMAMADDERHLIDDPYGQAFTGARDAKVKLVVFIDYGCAACRESQPVLDRLVAEAPNLEVVYRIVDNDDGSMGVSGVSLEVARSDRSWQAFHHALDAGNAVSDDAIGKALDAVHLKQSCYLPSETAGTNILVIEELQRNRNFLFERKLTAFPSWVIGHGPVHVGIDYATLKSAIAKAGTGAR
jgi:protein-disulfide isomerase